jgi:hypothetical protein
MKLKIEPVKVPRGYIHPMPKDDVLPRHEFSLGLVAPKGSGKTTVLVNLLQFYKGYFHSILVFSPTVASDEKWDFIKEQDLLADNIALKKWLKETESEDNSVVDAQKPRSLIEGMDLEPLKDFKIPETCFFNDYDESTLQSIMDEQMQVVKLLKEYGKSKHLANRILIIFDDLVGSRLFSGKRSNPFKMLNTNHRHYSASILMCSQAYKELPKTVRTNLSCLIIFEIPNDKEVEVIYEENSLYMKRKDWQEAYEYAVEGDHDFMFINYQKPKRLRLMKNFDQVLFVDG